MISQLCDMQEMEGSKCEYVVLLHQGCAQSLQRACLTRTRVSTCMFTSSGGWGAGGADLMLTDVADNVKRYKCWQDAMLLGHDVTLHAGAW